MVKQAVRQAVFGILLACGVLASTHSGFSVGYVSMRGSVCTLSFLLILSIVMLPPRLVLLGVPLAIALIAGLNHINELKIAAVGLPVTFLDIKMTLTEPSTILNAIGMRLILRQSVRAAIVGFLFALLAFGLIKVRRRLRVEPSFTPPARSRIFALTIKIAAAIVVVVIAQRSLLASAHFVQANLSKINPALWLDLWTEKSQVKLARQLGFMEYAAFTYISGDQQAQTNSIAWHEPPKREVHLASTEFLNDPAERTKKLPNIVFFHAESTFDPNIVFKLSQRVSSPMWSRIADTVAVGPLHVTVTGGGSWVTEFEVLTGVDHRIFGYDGYYPHRYIAPLTKNSFVSYLARKGYKTAGYYTVPGNFYNTENGFRAYGFQEFLEPSALHLPDSGEFTDVQMVQSVVERGVFESTRPFFYFISTTENHGPHPCQHYTNETQFKVTFAAASSFQQNCALNEYLRRAESTSKAFELVLDKLKDVEHRTGRPFVLLLYGDHQPWSFTDGLYSIAGGLADDQGIMDLSNVRATSDGYVTIFHLLASDKSILKGSFTQPPPATLLPAIVSAFVASSSDDLYLPINFLAFSKCGADVQVACELYPDMVAWWKRELFTPKRAGEPQKAGL
jgi:phosphoglycerol transferase MdoB-like AlkP superfamily enzyme